MSRYPRLAAAGLAAAVIALAACTRPAPGHSASEAPQDLPTAVEASALAHPFAIGTLEAFVLHDGDITVSNDGSVLPRGEGDDSIDALLAANGLPTDVLRLSVQALLVRAHGRVILFDTGVGDAAFADAGRLGQALRVAGVEPGQVTDIFVSHAHPDHVGGLLDADGGLAFPDATVRMSAPEWAALQADEGRSALAAAIAPRVETFEPGAAAIVPGVDAVPVDGHTPGHSAYRIGDGVAQVLYIGDGAHHHVVSVQRPHWTIAFDGDAPKAGASREALLARAADEGLVLVSPHFPFPGIGRIGRRDGGFTWVPAE